MKAVICPGTGRSLIWAPISPSSRALAAFCVDCGHQFPLPRARGVSAPAHWVPVGAERAYLERRLEGQASYPEEFAELMGYCHRRPFDAYLTSEEAQVIFNQLSVLNRRFLSDSARSGMLSGSTYGWPGIPQDTMF